MPRPARETALAERMERLGISEDDLEERFIGGSGPGGQKINKTSSCVSLTHRPTGIEIQCQEARSQSANRHLARVRLCDRLEAAELARKAEKARLRAKKRYQKRRRSAGEKAEMLRDKRHRSEKKSQRGRVRPGD
ncbi:MAG: peptide chain release factor-like protein [Verrucomicrobiales bacterium]|nr:peptide chain release factor-like protein [Verrucomicrobiales bacterium]